MRENHPLIDSLYALARRDDRAALADLRRSFVMPMAAMPYVVPFLRKDATDREERALTLVAGLFALHPSPGGASLGRAMRQLAQESDSVELRFRALLDSDLEDLGSHLRHAVSLVRSKEIALDYDDLLRKVLEWDRASKKAQRAWARDFWGMVSGDAEGKE